MTIESADLVLFNGAIYTVDAQRTWAEAVAIAGGRIAAVGTEDAIKPYIGYDTQTINLDGKMVLPGFFDCHAHPSAAVSMVVGVNLFGKESQEAYHEVIAEFAQANPDLPVIRGAGWSNALFPVTGPSRKILDALVRDRPVYISSEDGHSFWVNSRTLELASITKDTPDPEGGVIERDPATGEPSGTLRESAMDLVSAVLPDYTTEEREQGILAYQEMAGKAGVTTVHEATATGSIEAYKALETEGLLTMRYRGSLLIEPNTQPEHIAAIAKERSTNTGHRFKADSAKIFVDGVVEGETAYLLQPYAHRPDYRGELLWDPENLKRIFAALDSAGFQIHVHSIGDAATRITLDAFEYAQRTNGRRDSRHLITHLQLVHPDDIPRFVELGVVGVPQPFWFSINAYYWNLELPYLGKERADAEYPMQSLIEAGVVLASGSDFPVTIPFDPLIGIQIGITRSAPGKTTDAKAVLKEGEWGVLGPDERAGLEDMIASFTINGAYANFLEKETGSLETGKLADMVVLDHNLFEIPATNISDVTVLQTLFEGQEVYRDPGF